MRSTVENKNIVVAGFGKSGQASAQFLNDKGLNFSVWDTRQDIAIPDWVNGPFYAGELPDNFWQNIDIAIVSPGLALSHPELQRAVAHDVELIGEIELFARYNNASVIGITGSNGKTTVTLLVTHILKAAGMDAVAAGNVGTPALSTLNDAPDWVVLELSSFQLETTHSLQLEAATILNISDDHLDRHKTLTAYSDAKQRIYNHASHALCWREQQVTYPLPLAVEVTEFGASRSDDDFGLNDNWITWQGEKLLDVTRVKLTGTHNILNIQAAVGLAMLAGVPAAAAAEAVYSFEPVPHRCVQVASYNDVSWIDDSKATNVGATLAAITGIGAQCAGKLILIAGGDAKGADLSIMRDALHAHVDILITLGKDGPAIAALYPEAIQVETMHRAVEKAYDLACAGDTVLLSPACASLDMFDNYEHRAAVFKHAISEVHA
ncbi:UDP-N-acetylmuramoyl-L-alanine--D-glutamate ligase [Salinimonas sp. HHU 13199]|uniref:UDP-N-acetylmuramoylalanine--D-glutamate ligase n=1 Tax=Salinimonas profundi TaxID=2729140 RepID=A0ABR8LIR9_9ALTE|nr:UDP-N-acetylmuramoyl-L-alanine--D-glutamate ligase [Salinimonas profundi]MBD3586112.1 UDP-N-acetylmuramoyl-L-alanine--D-glutamate ligase [Salinimonas profundi]